MDGVRGGSEGARARGGEEGERQAASEQRVGEGGGGDLGEGDILCDAQQAALYEHRADQDNGGKAHISGHLERLLHVQL